MTVNSETISLATMCRSCLLVLVQDLPYIFAILEVKFSQTMKLKTMLVAEQGLHCGVPLKVSKCSMLTYHYTVVFQSMPE